AATASETEVEHRPEQRHRRQSWLGCGSGWLLVSLSFVTPLGALIALVGLIPLAVLLIEESRLEVLCKRLGLRPPTWRPSVEVGVALTVLVAVLALGLAQPVVASHTTREGPADAEAFFGSDRPASLGTKIGALADLVTGNYFEDAAKKRVVVVFTDGETLKERLSTLPARFKDGHLRVFFFHYWRPDQRVYNAAGQIIPAYLPDPNTTAVLDGLARSTSSTVFKPGQVGQASAAVRAVIGNGPTRARGRELNSFLLAPYGLLAALLPLGFLLFRRNFPAPAQLRRAG